MGAMGTWKGVGGGGGGREGGREGGGKKRGMEEREKGNGWREGAKKG